MARRSPRRRSRSSGGDGWLKAAGVALAALSLAGMGGIAYVYATADAPPALDKATLCPLDGPRSITVALLDTSDPLPEVTRREVTTRLTDLAEGLPAHGLLEIRILDPEHPGGRVLLSRCNPGDGSNLSELTANPAMARKRWLSDFRQPVEAALEGSLKPAPSKWSPIMAAIQRVAVERFDGKAREGVPKSLVIVSDMVEHQADYSQYAGDLTFARFKGTAAHARMRTDLKGADVTVLYVQRLGGKGRDPGQHIQFWGDWLRDSNGRLHEAVKLQGAA